MLAQWLMLFAAGAAGESTCPNYFLVEDPIAIAYVAEHFPDQWTHVTSGAVADALSGFRDYIDQSRDPDYLRPTVYALTASAARVQRTDGPQSMLQFLLLARDFQDRLSRPREQDRAISASIDVGIGTALQIAGRHAEAIDAYQRAQRESRRIRGRPGAGLLAMAQAFEASVAYDQRNYRRVETLVTEARQRTDDPFVEAWADILLAATYRQQGDYREAQTLLEDLINRPGLDCARMLLALARRNLGELKIYYKPIAHQPLSTRLDEALLHLSAAEKEYADLVLDIERAISLSHIAEITLKRNNFEQAEHLLRQALTVFEKAGFQDGIGRLHHHLGQVARLRADASRTPEQQEEREAAVKSFNRSLEIYTRLGDPEWQWRSLLGRGAARESYELQSAKDDYRAAARILLSMRQSLAEGALPEHSGFADSYREVFSRLIAILLREGDIDDALAMIAASDAITLRRQFLLDARYRRASGDEDQIGQECTDLLLRYPEQQQRSVVTSFVHSASNMIDTGDGVAQAESEAMPLPIGNLPADTAILTYRVHAKNIDIVLRSPERQMAIHVPYAESDLRDDIAAFIRLIRTTRFDLPDRWKPGGRGEAGYNRELIDAAESFHDLLVSPLSEQLSGVQTLFIHTNGVLELLPFSVLAQRGDDGEPVFLVDRFDVRRFMGSQSRKQRSPVADTPHVVAFADPENRGGSSRDRLAESAKFAEAVLRPMFSADVYLDVDATKVNLRRAWPGANILHIGAHGVITTRSPYLLMAPDDVQGRLSSCEILDLPYHDRLQLVVLEACESAVAARGSGGGNAENLSSIGSAFGSRGARNVVATLWRVGQNASVELMHAFYRELKQGATPGAALRRAKSMLRNSDGVLAQPYYWAGFTIFEKLEQG